MRRMFKSCLVDFSSLVSEVEERDRDFADKEQKHISGYVQHVHMRSGERRKK